MGLFHTKKKERYIYTRVAHHDMFVFQTSKFSSCEGIREELLLRNRDLNINEWQPFKKQEQC